MSESDEQSMDDADRPHPQGESAAIQVKCDDCDNTFTTAIWDLACPNCDVDTETDRFEGGAE